MFQILLMELFFVMKNIKKENETKEIQSISVEVLMMKINEMIIVFIV